ncbi:LPS assembly lipoprotein LptE [Hydrogenophaga sp. 5NK40-0174]|uniref:LPS-assembly lipoprotein LptE n=1 Tax=Hydrogenophaga sp. 5NK40-0174 TaxID=3127649 RepID=UPI00333F4C06
MTQRRLPLSSRRAWLAAAGALPMAAVLSGCGFTLRKAPKFAFERIRFDGNWGAPVSRELQNALRSAGLSVIGANAPAEQQRQAQVVLNVLTDQRERAVVGQTATGQVRELQLRTRFRFGLKALNGRVLLDDAEIVLERDISFSETAALAKAAEEESMFEDMQGDIVQQVMRRLAAVKSI